MIRLAPLARFVPRRWEVPARFHYHRWRGVQEPEIDLLPELVARDRRAIDVGANFGDYTYALARIVRNVEAFEPLGGCAAVIEAARLPCVRVHRVALSDGAGERTLHLPLQGGRPDTGSASFLDPGGTRDRIKVPVRTLDSYGFRDVGLIKIDVEGHESAVLAGAGETIRACRPVLIVEIEQRHRSDCTIDAVFAEFLALGYTGSFLEGGARRPLATFSYERHQAPFIGAFEGGRGSAHVGAGSGPSSWSQAPARAMLRGGTHERYVNNFIFVPQA
jgi:FkbM family methyltransferase